MRRLALDPEQRERRCRKTKRASAFSNFFFIEWPEGTKDANDFLRSDGATDLRDKVIHAPMPWPVDGLFRMSDLPDPPPMTVWHLGFDGCWNDRCNIAAGTLSVVTGHPGMGKTTL
ncbi:hypothetical protein ACVIWV_006005 [Bradyrhizobium diazoefficiens]